MWMESYTLHVVLWVWLISLSTQVHPHPMCQKFIPFFGLNFLKNLFLAVLDLHCYAGFSLVVESRGYSLVALHGFLIGTACLVAEPGP